VAEDCHVLVGHGPNHFTFIERTHAVNVDAGGSGRVRTGEAVQLYSTGINKRKEKIKQDVEKLKNELNEKKEALKKIASALTTDE
jgi:hypothetical protein